MAAPRPTASDISATEKIEANIALLADRTTYGQFAKSYKALRSVALSKRVSEAVKFRAFNELRQAMVRGRSWFSPPLDLWPEGQGLAGHIEAMRAYGAVNQRDQQNFLNLICKSNEMLKAHFEERMANGRRAEATAGSSSSNAIEEREVTDLEEESKTG
ncbi:uncharacterized protein AB675_3014 [Cyphellophora attinorum]|uniref:Uncharacterized protein n=1 Tax=Cyphellophora attinorum TaxID=1664694 RepID=A0A0N0NKI3_9EURO|nr:uncharacterized protein AB675_3014 [Phialophora attinorum]KPI37879.1 hypothetical protein AB675_3014 [Phialophora attinorum]